MRKKDAKELLKKYRAGHCTEEEKALLESWYLHWRKDHQLPLSGKELDEDLAEIWLSLPVHRRETLLTWPRAAAAAAILAVLSIGVYFFRQAEKEPAIAQAAGTRYETDIPPGGNKAVLTLADGRQVVLDEAATGELAEQGNVHISKTGDGMLVYRVTADTDAGKISYNTVSTPNGGQYKIILPDGTRAWLNAASSLRYPTVFGDRQRMVELTGEGYFEVAKDESRPFLVRTKKQEIKVLGTHFNVMAYENEPAVLTTLLEGKVLLSVLEKETSDGEAGRRWQALAPGQQASLEGDRISIGPAPDLSAAVAWKNGRFIFANESIESIMRKVARWYDVEIVYQGDMKGKDFIGSVSRYDNVSKLLEMLELTRTVHFKIEGRRITVMP